MLISSRTLSNLFFLPKWTTSLTRPMATSSLRRPDRKAVIVGLGNPGAKYQHNRHNVGFSVIDALDFVLSSATGTDPLQFSLQKGPRALVKSFALPESEAPSPVLQRVFGADSLRTREVLLVKPQTYMNLSGNAVASLYRELHFHLDDLLVVYDDLGLPPGTLHHTTTKISQSHNGFHSIYNALGYKNAKKWSRLRFGIGRPTVGDVAKYVLSDFSPEEHPLIHEAKKDAVEMIGYWLRFPTDQAFNKYTQDRRKSRMEIESQKNNKSIL